MPTKKTKNLSLKLTLDDVSQTIDLKKTFGFDFSKQPELKELIGQEIIEFMLDRIAKGKGIGGKKLSPKYSKEYIGSLEFKSFGKKRSPINMELKGDMLASIDILEAKGNKVKIGFDDNLETKKAFNHNTGDSKGMPKRPFFGINEKELSSIKSELKSELEDVFKEKTKKDQVKKALSIIKALRK